MHHLIPILEKATQPSRQIDVLLYLWGTTEGVSVRQMIEQRGTLDHWMRAAQRNPTIPYFTTDPDAALRLVKPGTRPTLGKMDGGATPALSICIGAIKAQIAAAERPAAVTS
jgi:hypothetical protein